MPCARCGRRLRSRNAWGSSTVSCSGSAGSRSHSEPACKPARWWPGTCPTDQTLVTGDTVNTAARLEQAATPGEILLGEPTYRLVRDAMTRRAGRADHRQGKGAAGAGVSAAVRGSGRRGSPAQARQPAGWSRRGAGVLRDRFERVDGGPCSAAGHRFGPAGIGKSRLVAELVATIDQQATVLKGRCLPYGDGITYWPLREILHAAAGIGEGDSADEAQGQAGGAMAGDAADAELLARRVGTALGLVARARRRKRSSGPRAGFSST